MSFYFSSICETSPSATLYLIKWCKYRPVPLYILLMREKFHSETSPSATLYPLRM